MQGRLVAKFMALSAQELQAKTTAAVKRSGTYLVKPQTGRQMQRVTVK
jgi:beta-galactosidase